MMTRVRLVFLFFKAIIQWLLDEWEMKAECFLPLLLSRKVRHLGKKRHVQFRLVNT